MLHDQGKKVIMVGDGMNNAPELIALGGGTCAALSSGYIIRMKSDIRQILYTLGSSQYSMRKVKQNYLAHFFIALSMSAGLFHGVTNSLVLRSALAALE
jgi:Cu+-exporting ATPase